MLYFDDHIAHTRRDELLREAKEHRKALQAYQEDQNRLTTKLLKSIRSLTAMLGVL